MAGLELIRGGKAGLPRLPKLQTGAASPRILAALVIVEILILVGIRNVFRTVHGG